MDVSMALGICWGVKVRGSRRLKCGEPVDDPRIIEETMKLINEFINRVEKHRAILLSDSNTPFDNAINALNNWLRRIEAKVEEDNDEGIANLRRAMLNVGGKMLELVEEARKRWLSTYRRELEELVEKLRSGDVKVTMNGEPFDGNKSFTAHLYTENLAITIDRVAKSRNVTIQISLTGLKGTHVVTPRLFDDGRLRAMQCGLLLTDGSIDKEGYPTMSTAQLWQVIAWLIAWPGKNRIRIHGLSLNDGDVSVTWQLRAVDHKGVFENKPEVAKATSKLGDEEFPPFLLYVILGDGDVNVEEKSVRLYMGRSKLELWGGIIDRLEGLGFRRKDGGYRVVYVVRYSKAIELAKKMLSEPSIKALIEDLSQLPDAEKPRRLITLASIVPKPKGRSSIEVAGMRMSIHVYNSGAVELRARRWNYEDVISIQERLKGAGYNAELRSLSRYFEVYICHSDVKKRPELVAKACEVLKRMHEEAANEGKGERAWLIARAMVRLNCPAQSPRT
ncbi:hypothetical protein JCM16161A_10620 [Vulcanisaeta sp. JCM 16161]|uniref:hypothetical protein n=1 Tax=Vulcanisaeta sp. JCM 16161 TaxID=1295372 RepID=UPI000B2F9C8F|nr:hypothetical protein [Vulcanisaeta sp. JCM 16161]